MKKHHKVHKFQVLCLYKKGFEKEQVLDILKMVLNQVDCLAYS